MVRGLGLSVSGPVAKPCIATRAARSALSAMSSRDGLCWVDCDPAGWMAR